MGLDLASAQYAIYGFGGPAAIGWLAAVHDFEEVWKVEIAYGDAPPNVQCYVTSVRRAAAVDAIAGQGVADAAYAALDGLAYLTQLDKAVHKQLARTVRRERTGLDAELVGWAERVLVVDGVQVPCFGIEYGAGWAYVVPNRHDVALGYSGVGDCRALERLDSLTLRQLRFPEEACGTDL